MGYQLGPKRLKRGHRAGFFQLKSGDCVEMENRNFKGGGGGGGGTTQMYIFLMSSLLYVL